MVVTASKLREDVYNILDSVLETGEPVEIERKGRVLRIVAEPAVSSRVARIIKRPGLINGNPEDLAEVDLSSFWNPDGNF
jgi:hypothetical protein